MGFASLWTKRGEVDMKGSVCWVDISVVFSCYVRSSINNEGLFTFKSLVDDKDVSVLYYNIDKDRTEIVLWSIVIDIIW